MKATGQVVWQDFLHAQLLSHQNGLFRRIVSYFIIIMCTTIAVGGVVMTILGQMSLEIMLPFICLVGAFYLARFVLIPIMSKQSFQQAKEFNSPFEYEIDDSHIMLNTLYNRSSRPLSELVKWKEDKNLILLYYTPQCFYILPKRFFSDPQQIETLRALIKPKITQKPKTIFNVQTISVMVILLIVIISVIVTFLKNS